MTIDTIEIEATDGSAVDELTVTLRGKSAKVMEVLIGGLPREGLLELREALAVECAKRGIDLKG